MSDFSGLYIASSGMHPFLPKDTVVERLTFDLFDIRGSSALGQATPEGHGIRVLGMSAFPIGSGV